MARRKKTEQNVSVDLDDIMTVLLDGQKVLEKCSDMINESKDLDASNDSEFAKSRADAVGALSNFVNSTTVLMTKLSDNLNTAIAANTAKLQEKQDGVQNVE